MGNLDRETVSQKTKHKAVVETALERGAIAIRKKTEVKFKKRKHLRRGQDCNIINQNYHNKALLP